MQSLRLFKNYKYQTHPLKYFRVPHGGRFLFVVSCQESSPVLHSRTEARSHCCGRESRKRVNSRGSRWALKPRGAGGALCCAGAAPLHPAPSPPLTRAPPPRHPVIALPPPQPPPLTSQRPNF
ncbi:hypothetical protein RR46_06950 [Papilio xuthus]|uniref:Uncharacterized protein n=1 Tax=Papilio xuthus TaxID=66420 RepID=A0A194PRZ4_PAPXU|nr:hypothetical protein RR46_06950 [Papilio xuthus]